MLTGLGVGDAGVSARTGNTDVGVGVGRLRVAVGVGVAAGEEHAATAKRSSTSRRTART